MRKSLLAIIIFISVLLGTRGVFAIEIICPPGEKPVVTPDTITASIEECLNARKNHNEGSLNTAGKNYYCPSGDFTTDDEQATTNERIAMQIGTSLLFAEIDYDALKKICDMRESRDTDSMKWTVQINDSFVSGPNDGSTGDSTKKSALARYRNTCANGGTNVMKIVNANSKKIQWISTTSAFPQAVCDEKAEQKADAWAKLGYTLMSENIAKGYQNDKDKFVDKVKTKYDTVREKLHSLLELIDKGTAKLTNLIKDAVK